MPVPLPTPQPGGLGGVFASLGAVAGPLMMVIMAMRSPGPVKMLLDAGADSPDSARRPETLGVKQPPLQPLIRARVVVCEPDGRVWVDRNAARSRQRRLMAIFAAIGLLVGLAVWALLRF